MTQIKKYEADKLIIAKLKTISSIPYETETKELEQKYFFELVMENEEIKYREIFTGLTTDCIEDIENKGINKKYFDTPFVEEPEIFTNTHTEYKGKILTQEDLSLILKKMNSFKKNESQNRK